MGEITRNLRDVQDRIARAAERAGRDPKDVLLVAVTKTVSADRINEAIDAGVKAIGENRVQEAEAKWPDLHPGPERHMVGSLQRNKAGRAVELFDRIQSVDREKLAEAISRRAAEAGKVIPVLVEVNVSGEESKAGVPPAGLTALLTRMAALEGIRVEGLMTIGPWTTDGDRIRESFRLLRGLFEERREKPIEGIAMEHLSMGMSGDFEMAIEEGATMVRVGTAIFGTRPA